MATHQAVITVVFEAADDEHAVDLIDEINRTLNNLPYVKYTETESLT